MNKAAFYPKLAMQNIGRNKQFYLPYLFTCLVSVAMFYVLCFLQENSATWTGNSGEILGTILILGIAVIGLFSTVVLFYTNSFLMKRRQKELGLYNILGMGKGNISVVLFFETLYVSLISLIAGLGLGIAVSKLALFLLGKLASFDVPKGIELSPFGLVLTLGVFCGIFLLILFSNFIRLRLSNPVELLKGGNVGEKEPKTKWVLAVLGVITLGIGYYIAISTEAPLKAIMLFFVAVILVIAGTYLLFTAGSIALLKQLKANKGYYYRTKNFIPVSGMIYRMKQNAVGLANICILATMVLVMVSGTVSLYMGTEDAIKTQFPSEIAVTMGQPSGKAAEIIKQTVDKTVSDMGLTATDFTDKMPENPLFEGESGYNRSDYSRWYYGFELDGTSQQKIDCREALDEAIGQLDIQTLDPGSGYDYVSVNGREENRSMFFTITGGFLFLGLFLGLVFLMATVLIIYYKQLSEGYEDKERFEIMQKVGLSKAEIKKAIRSQVLVVFFLPLGMAVVHIAFAFKMITKLLLVFSLTNTTLFAICTLATVGVFALIYGLVYTLTARTYYKIVSE